jgi:hypothetical protein
MFRAHGLLIVSLSLPIPDVNVPVVWILILGQAEERRVIGHRTSGCGRANFDSM